MFIIIGLFVINDMYRKFKKSPVTRYSICDGGFLVAVLYLSVSVIASHMPKRMASSASI